MEQKEPERKTGIIWEPGNEEISKVSQEGKRKEKPFSQVLGYKMLSSTFSHNPQENSVFPELTGNREVIILFSRQRTEMSNNLSMSYNKVRQLDLKLALQSPLLN